MGSTIRQGRFRDGVAAVIHTGPFGVVSIYRGIACRDNRYYGANIVGASWHLVGATFKAGPIMIKLIIQGIVAFGSIDVAVLAIWGDWVRSKLAPLKLTLTLPNPNGDPMRYESGTRAMFYHLKVINHRSWASAENCRVLLVGLSRRDPSGTFQPVSVPFPLQFIWTQAEFTLPIITLMKEHMLTLGRIEENSTKFTPNLYVTPHNFQGFVGKQEAVRFHLQIEAANFSSPLYVIEVAWDGVWSFEPDTMKRHLPVNMI